MKRLAAAQILKITSFSTDCEEYLNLNFCNPLVRLPGILHEVEEIVDKYGPTIIVTFTLFLQPVPYIVIN
jgi:hypothetical protein